MKSGAAAGQYDDCNKPAGIVRINREKLLWEGFEMGGKWYGLSRRIFYDGSVYLNIYTAGRGNIALSIKSGSELESDYYAKLKNLLA